MLRRRWTKEIGAGERGTGGGRGQPEHPRAQICEPNPVDVAEHALDPIDPQPADRVGHARAVGQTVGQVRGRGARPRQVVVEAAARAQRDQAKLGIVDDPEHVTQHEQARATVGVDVIRGADQLAGVLATHEHKADQRAPLDRHGLVEFDANDLAPVLVRLALDHPQGHRLHVSI